MMKPASFYGPPTLGNLRRTRDLTKAEAMVHTPMLRSVGPVLAQNYPEDLHVYSTQRLAIDKAKENPELGLKTFAFEMDVSGKRSFMVCHPLHMWSIILNRKKNKRYFYEVIPEGEPCKLYFDLEFDKEKNPNTNGEEALERFKSHVETSIHRHLDVSKSKISAIDLDSSNEHKFSHHLIFDIQGFAFKNNYAVGSFVRKILSDISGDLESTVAVKTKDGITSTFVDSGVYTKNRNFRMFLCSKFGKTSVLKCQTSSSDSAKTIFLSSLVTYFCHSRKLINFGTEVVSKSDQADLVLAFKKPRLDTKATSTSIFPEIDQFICDLILPGTIRKIIWKPNESTLEYETQGYRFCENIQRCHKSNNVKLVVLLSKGVYFQVCHDPDCEGFKGQDKQIPVDSQPWLQLFEEDEKENDLDDGEDSFLMAAAEQAELEAVFSDEDCFL